MGGTQDFSPTWSPNGARIAFWRFYDTTLRVRIDRIMVMNRDGSGKRYITPASRTASDPAWSPDGSEIAFSRRVPHVETDTMTMWPDGRDSILVARHTREPAWRPAACTITGTSGPDRLVGTPGNNVIGGLGGDDVIAGMGGQDVISGGRGNDTVSFRWAPAGVRVRLALHAFAHGTEFLSGIENVTGSPFGDLIRGGGLPNVIRGLAGNDLIRGGLGRDHLYGGPGDDTIDARDGHPGDVVDGGRGSRDLCLADPGDLVRRC